MQENLRTIEQSVMRIDRIVLDLMDTVSIEQGRLALSLVPSDLSGLLYSAKKTTAVIQAQRTISWSLRHNPDSRKSLLIRNG